MSDGLRTALVTGGNRGIGFEACRQLARSGLRVVLTARDPELGAAAPGKARLQRGLKARQLTASRGSRPCQGERHVSWLGANPHGRA